MPKPLDLTEPIIEAEFIHMPGSPGLGHYPESGHIITVQLHRWSDGNQRAGDPGDARVRSACAGLRRRSVCELSRALSRLRHDPVADLSVKVREAVV